MQLLINQINQEIICVVIGRGRKHGFRIFKDSKIKAIPEIEIIADKGYKGINRYHTHSGTPYKKPKKGQLITEQKQDNRNHARARIKIEYMIRFLKIFKILSSRYRNRRKRFGLLVNLSAGIYNYKLKMAT